MTDESPEFGEGVGVDAERASSAVYVRRPLNDFTDYEEVFEFSAREPQADEATDEATIGVRYFITREARTGRVGIEDAETDVKLVPMKDVPGEVIVRAEKMVRATWDGFMPEGDDE